MSTVALNTAALWKRVTAFLYDALVMAGVLFVVTGIAVGLNDGEALPSGHWGLRVALFGITALYVVTSWAVSGYTLGQKAWRIQVRSEKDATLRFGQALWRFFIALLCTLPFGLGWWFALFRADGLSLHDVLTRTRVVQLPK